MTDITGSVSTLEESKEFNSNQNAKETQRSMNFDKDARSVEGGGDYPNYWCHKTRSGHSITMDDSKGNETLTIQHRSGTAIQMKPDGGMLMTTHNGKYEVVFGEERVTISGARDITVKGDASLRVYGNHNTTVHGDHNMTVLGDHNITAKNMNYSVRGNIDTEAKNINTRVEGSGTYNYLGAVAVSSKGNMSHISTGGKMSHGAAKGYKVKVVNGPHITHVKKGNFSIDVDDGEMVHKIVTQQSGASARRFGAGAGGGQNKVEIQHKDGSTTHKVTRDHVLSSEIGDVKTQVKTGDHMLDVTAGTSKTKTGQNIEQQAGQNFRMAASKIEGIGQSDLNLTSLGSAVFHGVTTHVGGSGQTSVVGTGGLNLDALGGLLNIQGGLGQIGSLLGLAQLAFDFGDIPEISQMAQFIGTNADQPQQEPDASSEIDSWQ